MNPRLLLNPLYLGSSPPLPNPPKPGLTTQPPKSPYPDSLCSGHQLTPSVLGPSPSKDYFSRLFVGWTDTGTLKNCLAVLVMSEFWLCFNCCIAEQPQPKRRRRIDRSMIGEPTNFVHTAHVGSGDLFSGMNSVNSIQNQMQSKGGYEGDAMPVNVQLQLVDTKAG